MTPDLPARGLRCLRFGLFLAVVALGFSFAGTSGAQPAGAALTAEAAPSPEQGPRWSELKPAQQLSLRPLEQEWSRIDLEQKQKWLTIASRFQKLNPEEQGRIQARMAAWAMLSSKERAQARMNYQEARQLPRADREARWKAYQALSPEERAQLAARAAAANRPPTRAGGVGGRPGAMPNPDYSARPRPIGPIVVQAAPGATTTLLTRRPMPPRHQQTGMPKIAATPEFVNKATLLPQRGPQGAATRSTSSFETPQRK